MRLPITIKTTITHQITLFLIGAIVLLSANAAAAGVIPPKAKVHGLTYAEWGAAWWQWAYSIPFAQNPNYDASGAFDDRGQSGHVWFLPVTAPFGGIKERVVTVPRGKHILVPTVIGSWSYPCAADPSFQPAPGQTVEDLLRSTLVPLVDYVEDLITTGLMTAEVDGNPVKKLEAYRATSDLFDLTADPSISIADPYVTGSAQPTVSDGFWLLLAPLSKGYHTVHYRIEAELFPGGGEDVTFHIIVE